MVPKSFSNFNKNKKHFLYDGQKTLHYLKDFHFYHLSPQMISIEEIALEFLHFSQNRAIKAQLPIENGELLTRAQGLIYQGQRNFSGDVVVLGFISGEYLFGLVNFSFLIMNNFFAL